MSSVKYDNTEILNITYTPRFIKHENAPERTIDAINLAREDGSVFITERYGVKRIRLQGILNGSSQDDLESKIDSFKELFSRIEKNLDISWNATTRRYVASVEFHEFNRDYFHLLFVPWTAEFIVLSGEGKDTISTEANKEDMNANTPTDIDWTFLGSKPPKPIITLTPGGAYPNPSDARGIEIRNNQTLEKVIFTNVNGFGAGGGFATEFDFENKTVEFQSVLRDFYGSFSKFIIGLNEIRVTMGGIICQETPLIAGGGGAGLSTTTTNIRLAQGFQIPRDDLTFQSIKLSLTKTGSPGNLTVDIVEDNNGAPTGAVIKTFVYAPGDVPTTPSNFQYVIKTAASMFGLSADQTYWIVARGAGVDGANYYTWEKSNTDIYNKGVSSLSNNGGTTWIDSGGSDFLFQLIFGGKREASGQVEVKTDYYKTYL